MASAGGGAVGRGTSVSTGCEQATRARSVNITAVNRTLGILGVISRTGHRVFLYPFEGRPTLAIMMLAISWWVGGAMLISKKVW